jgi:hypothetical protein
MKNSIILLAALLLVSLGLPGHGAAQLRLIPQAGLFAPVSDLGRVSTQDGAREVGERESSFAYGLALEVGGARTLGVRVSGMYGSDAEVPVGGIGCSGDACDLRSTVLTLTGSLVFRPFPSLLVIRPYVMGGGGLKRYDFDFSRSPFLENVMDDERELSGHLGIGVEWDIGVLGGTVELSDYMSPSPLDDGETQHDFFLTLGVIL